MTRSHRRWHPVIWLIVGSVAIVLGALAVAWRPAVPIEPNPGPAAVRATPTSTPDAGQEAAP